MPQIFVSDLVEVFFAGLLLALDRGIDFLFPNVAWNSAGAEDDVVKSFDESEPKDQRQACIQKGLSEGRDVDCSALPH